MKARRETRRRALALATLLLVGPATACRDRPQHGSSPTQAQLRAPGHSSDAQSVSRGASAIAELFRAQNLFGTPDGLPRTPPSFSRAKRRALEIYADHRTTFYCGCGFGEDRAVLWPSCGYAPRANERRATRIEWEHVVPAYAFGSHRDCWKEKLCVKPNSGKKYRGRQCCGRIDEQFRKMEADLVNLVPAVGEINGDRAHFSFGDVAGEPREYGACDFEVDQDHQVAEPPPAVRGDIARAYLYMHFVYANGLPLSAEQVARFERWHRDDPPTDWERMRDRRITEIQGGGNPLVK